MWWVFWLYAAIVFSVSKILKIRRKKKIQENGGEEKTSSLRVIFIIFKNLVIFFVGFIIFLWSVMTYEYYLFFTDKRTGKIEEKFGIIVDENIDLKNYRRFFGGIDSDNSLMLEFESDISGSEFMDKNCIGKEKNYNSDFDYFRYKYSGKYFYVTFRENGDSYNAKIRY